MHFCDFFCIFAPRTGYRCICFVNAKSLKVQVFWRTPQDIRTNAIRFCPARRKNLPRAGQISSYTSPFLLHPVLIPVTTGLFPFLSLVLNHKAQLNHVLVLMPSEMRGIFCDSCIAPIYMVQCTNHGNPLTDTNGFLLAYSYLFAVREGTLARKNKKNGILFGFLLAYSYLCSRISENPKHLTTRTARD